VVSFVVVVYNATCPTAVDVVFFDDIIGGCGYFGFIACFCVVVLDCCIGTVISSVCCGEFDLVEFFHFSMSILNCT